MATFNGLKRKVRAHLESSESIEHGVCGVYETKILGTEMIRNGAFFATSHRLVFYAKKLFGYDMEVFPYENLSSLEISKGFMGHTLSFFASGNKVKMKWITQGDIKGFTELVKTRMGKKSVSEGTQQAPSDDIPAQILKLSKLKDHGIISEQDFEAKKQELLKRM
jgi:hypothetical protein